MSNPENQNTQQTSADQKISRRTMLKRTVSLGVSLLGASAFLPTLLTSCDNKPEKEIKTWLSPAENEKLDNILEQIKKDPLTINENGLQLLERKFIFYSLYPIESKNPDIQRNENVLIAYPTIVIKLYSAAETGNYGPIKDKNLLEKRFQKLLLHYAEALRTLYVNDFTLTSNTNLNLNIIRRLRGCIGLHLKAKNYLASIAINYSQLTEKETQVLADKMRQYTPKIKRDLPGYKNYIYSFLTSQFENEANQIEQSFNK